MTGNQHEKPTLVVGGTGKTGRRVVDRLAARGLPTRVGARSSQPPFDWEDQSTWAPALHGVGSAYITYFPDIAIPGAVEAVGSLTELALEQGARRLVLLSGRGEEEAQRAERVVQDSGADVTIVRCAWFMQNFSESYMLESIQAGELVLPADDQKLEPFIDADDIADVVVAALTDDRHIGELYELTSPRLLSFPEAIDEISAANRSRDPIRACFAGGIRRRDGRGRRARRVQVVPQLPVRRGSRSPGLRHRRRPARPRPGTTRLPRVRPRRRRLWRLEHEHGPGRNMNTGGLFALPRR
jgi:uncharacterized protein YbjT (DUF2867 family)